MERKNMWVCHHCLMAIEAHEGNQAILEHDVDEEEWFDSTEEYEQASKCDWCEQNGFDTLYELV